MRQIPSSLKLAAALTVLAHALGAAAAFWRPRSH
jgi:hypothetical protein